MPDVAIVVPVFNRPDRIARAVHSILAQSFQGFELVVVDDGSTDDLSAARRVVESAGHQWLRLPENVGPAAARNEGVKLSTANWISFLDSDDEWTPGKLEAQREWHRENTGVAISQVNEAWYRNGTLFSKPGHLRQESGDLFDASCQRCAIGPSCVMLTRELWDESGGFDKRFRVCEDFALWLRVASKYPVGLIPGEPLVKKHGGHPDQLSVATPLLERYRFLALLEFIRDFPGEPDRVATAREALLTFGDQLCRYGEKHRLTEWAAFFDSVDLSDAITPSVIDYAWLVFDREWRNPSEKRV